MAGSALTRVHSLRERLDETLSANRNEIVALLSRIEGKGKGILQHHQLIAEVEAIPEANRKTLLDGPFGEVLRAAQEAIVLPPWVALAVRRRPGVWEYIRVNVHALVVEELRMPEYLLFKEELVDGSVNGNFVRELDFEPFTASFPHPTLLKSIGNGVEFPNRHLSAKLFHDKESMHPLLENALPVIGQQNMEWVVDMREMSNNLEPPVSADCCIYRVPYHLRKWNEESYTPTVVSIGPLHHGDNRLQIKEREKVRCLDSFLGWTGLDLGVLESTVLPLEGRIRGCYGETIQLNSNDFVKMILLDVIFILQLFLSLCPSVHLQPRLRSPLIRDFILLENQIPFFIIDRLLALANPLLENPRTLKELTFAFFEVFVGKEPVSFPNVEIKHFTDLLRTFQLPPPERLCRDRSDVVKHLYTVSQLHKAGVKFKVSSSKFLLDLKFSNGVLEIPCICLEGRTEAVTRNLLAFEQCHYFDDACITDYYVILHYLLNTTDDVDLLCDKKIILNCLGNSNAAMSMVNSLNKGLVLKSMLSDYGRLSEALNEFYANPWHSWKATLRREYFSTPWRAASTMAAVIFLVLTMIQTVCSIIQVVPKHK